MDRDEQNVTTVHTPTVQYDDGRPCHICGRPRVFRQDAAGRTICGTGEDAGRMMVESDPCWTCRRDAETDETLDDPIG